MPLTLVRLTVVALTVVLGGCASRIVPDPRMPAPVKDEPVLLTVCYLEGEGAHLRVGDRVELASSALGRLRIRHLPASGPAWNGGKSARVRSTILVERVDPSDQNKARRRFVPVGRFKVEVEGQPSHLPFDFLASKATANLSGNPLPQCNVSLGDDEVLVRGNEDEGRHGGVAHLR